MIGNYCLLGRNIHSEYKNKEIIAYLCRWRRDRFGEDWSGVALCMGYCECVATYPLGWLGGGGYKV